MLWAHAGSVLSFRSEWTGFCFCLYLQSAQCVTLLLQALCRGCQRCSRGWWAGWALLQIQSAPKLCWGSAGTGDFPFCSAAGQPDPEDNCVFGKHLEVFLGYTIALLPVKGWRTWLCHRGSRVRPWPPWQPENVWLSVCLGQVWASHNYITSLHPGAFLAFSIFVTY